MRQAEKLTALHYNAGGYVSSGGLRGPALCDATEENTNPRNILWADVWPKGKLAQQLNELRTGGILTLGDAAEKTFSDLRIFFRLGGATLGFMGKCLKGYGLGFKPSSRYPLPKVTKKPRAKKKAV